MNIDIYRWLYNETVLKDPPKYVIEYLSVNKPLFTYKPESTRELETIPPESAFLVAIKPGGSYPIRYRNGKIYTSGEILIYRKIAATMKGLITSLTAIHYCSNEECMQSFDMSLNPGHAPLKATRYFADTTTLLQELKDQGLILVTPKILDPIIENVQMLEQLSINIEDTHIKKEVCEELIGQVAGAAKKIQDKLAVCEAADKSVETIRDQLALAKAQSESRLTRIQTLEETESQLRSDVTKWKKKWLELEQVSQRTQEALTLQVKKLKAELDANKKTVEQQQAEWLQMDEKLREAKQAIENRDFAVRELTTTAKTSDYVIRELTATVKTRDKTIKALQKENEEILGGLEECLADYTKEKERADRAEERFSLRLPIGYDFRRKMDLDSYAGSGEFV